MFTLSSNQCAWILYYTYVRNTHTYVCMYVWVRSASPVTAAAVRDANTRRVRRNRNKTEKKRKKFKRSQKYGRAVSYVHGTVQAHLEALVGKAFQERKQQPAVA